MKNWSAKLMAIALAATSSMASAQQSDEAHIFGARASIEQISLSPSGDRIAYIEPDIGRRSVLMVSHLTDGSAPQAVTWSEGNPWNLSWCGWASNTRLVCEMNALLDDIEKLVPASRMIALDIDGKNIKQLGQRSSDAMGFRQFDGEIIGWLADDTGDVVMSREYLPDANPVPSRLGNKEAGLGADIVNTSSLKSRRLEKPRPNAVGYIADDKGRIRIMQSEDAGVSGQLRGVSRYSYRSAGGGEWTPFSVDREGEGLTPAAVDSAQDIAYAFRKKDGRNAVYSVSLDGKMTEQLVSANDKVDIGGLIRFGRSGRVIGTQFVTDKREADIFEPQYKKLSAQLHKALPGLPLINFVDASRDENIILLFAGSDTDPGRYYIYDKQSKKLNEIALARPELEGKPLATVEQVQYPAADGTMIPAYLTLPPNSDGKNLKAIVMPHGGPSSRDEWGFDWLSQFYAAKGYAVLQPNFRGSAGYGDNWYIENGFKSWRVAVGDVNDAGRWLIGQGIADPQKLAIIGWSYGGYAALQSSVLDDKLFKAVVAIAPVTDLNFLIDQYEGFTNATLAAAFVGSGEHIKSGSPLQQAGHIKAPVLLFSGDRDFNVNVEHSKAMESALKKAGTPVELVIYKGLDHYLDDSAAREDMLSKSATFLEKTLLP